MERDHSRDEAQVRAALYTFGTMTEDEVREFEAHVQSGCGLCASEVRACRDVTDRLGHAAAPLGPPASTWDRVRERIAAGTQAPPATIDQDGIRIVRSAQLAWQVGRSPGVDVKTLFFDPRTGARTQLVRMPAGSALLPHRHADIEESYVLEGDLLLDGLPMAAGDYCRAEAGSLHRSVTTRAGCLFVAIISKPNEGVPTGE